VTTYTWHDKDGQVRGTHEPPTSPKFLSQWDQDKPTVVNGSGADPKFVAEHAMVSLREQQDRQAASGKVLSVDEFSRMQREYYNQYTGAMRSKGRRRVLNAYSSNATSVLDTDDGISAGTWLDVCEDDVALDYVELSIGVRCDLFFVGDDADEDE